MREKVTYSTKDGVFIIGDYYAPERKSTTGVLLLHMMPATRESFVPFAKKVREKGFHVLAVDLRGHGESVRQKAAGGETILDFRDFSDSDHQQSIADVRGAIDFLHSKGADDIAVIGASIGANLALQALSEDGTLKEAILLSPGLNYCGIETVPFVKKLHSGQKVFFVASRDDMRGTNASAESMAKELFGAVPSRVKKEICIFESAGHGTTIFERQPLFTDEIIRWLGATIPAKK